MSTFESEAVEVATLKLRNAQLLSELSDLNHLVKMHLLHGLADARAALAQLREKVAGEGHDADRAFVLIDAQLSDVAHKLQHRQCGCSGVDRVALEIAEAPDPEPGKVVPFRKVATVRKPPPSGVRDLLKDVVSALRGDKDPKGGGAA